MKIKEKKSFVILFILVSVILLFALLSFVVVRIVSDNCQRYYNEGRSAGYDEGFSAGEAAGREDGYNSRNAEVSQLKVRTKNLENDYNRIYDEYLFYSRSAVIVTTAGEKYHRFGCYHIAGSPFNIFNTEAAKARGYTPCLDCAPIPSFASLAENK